MNFKKYIKMPAKAKDIAEVSENNLLIFYFFGWEFPLFVLGALWLANINV